MRVAERNRAIKKVLVREFGRENVRVRGSRGTAYGWVHINVRVPKPHPGECERPEGWPYPYYECDGCRQVREATERKVWEILKSTGLENELFSYWDDMGDRRKECIVEVELAEKPELPDVIEVPDLPKSPSSDERKTQNLTELPSPDEQKTEFESDKIGELARLFNLDRTDAEKVLATLTSAIEATENPREAIERFTRPAGSELKKAFALGFLLAEAANRSAAEPERPNYIG